MSYVRETNNCNYTPKPTLSPIINFTIDGNAYQAERGMTWEQFITSDYNIAQQYGTYIKITDNFINYGNAPVTIGVEHQYVRPSDMIVDNFNYNRYKSEPFEPE